MNTEAIRKLHFDKYEKKLILNIPQSMDDFEGLSFDSVMDESKKFDLIFSFIFKLDQFTDLLNAVITTEMLESGGFLYFAYPKKGNKQYKEYIGRDDFFTQVAMDDEGYVNQSRIKFAKMIAFNDVFTVIGLKYQPETKNKSAQPSQCVSDYVDKIPDLQKYWANDNEVLNLFNNLTPGYQRGWARYVYSTRTPETQLKRLAEMADLLKQGYKSKDLYQQKKK